MYQSPQGNSCHLVVLEGADRLGKSTQAALLEAALEHAQVKAVVDKSPYRDGATYERIYEMLRSGEATRFPVVFQSIYGANRRVFQQTYLPTLASHFDVVVLDRWTLSGRVYGAEAGVADEVTDCIQRGLVEPDLTLLLDGTPFAAPAEDDAYEADQDFQRRLRDRYRAWAQTRPDARIIDANRSEHTVCQDLVRAILRLMNR